MNKNRIDLLDLPNEILFLILRKIENVDILLSFMDINNRRLRSIIQDPMFVNVLNFVPMLQLNRTMNSAKLDYFCLSILPRIEANIKSLVVESASMK